MTLYKNNTIDSFATGFERTFKYCKENGIKCEYSNTSTSFTFTFIRPNDINIDTINDTINVAKDNRLNAVIKLIKENSNITRNQLAKIIGTSSATIARDLKLMQEMGIVERVGSNKTGHWKFLK